MGTVPSPDIATLGGQIAQAPLNAFAEYQRAAQLQSQNQLIRQQTQAAQLENQRQQLAMNDQQAMTKAMHDWDGQDLGALPDLMRKNGISAGGYMAAQQQIVARRTQLAQLDKDQLGNMAAHHDAALGVIDSAKQVPDEQLAQHLSDSAQQLAAQGHLSPAEAQAIVQHAQSMPPDQFRPWLDIYEKGLMGENTATEQAIKDRETAAKETTAAAEKQRTEQGNWEVVPTLGIRVNKTTGETTPIAGAGGMMPPGMIEAKYIALAQKKAAGQPLSSDDAAWMKGVEKYKTLVPVANFNLQAAGVQGTGAAPSAPGGGPLSYAQQIKSFGAKGGVVQAIIEGRQDPPASFAQKSPYWQDVMQKVYAIDPQFNQQRAQLRKDYTVGKHSTEINAINTAMGHVGQLGDAIDALQNNDVQGLNRIANFLGVQIGQTPVTTFNTIVHRVGPELTKAYVGAGGGEADRGTTQKDFDPALGPSQLKSNVAITAKLLRSKISSLENQWDQNKAPSMPSFQQQFVMPEAQRQLDRWSLQGGAGGRQVSGGGHIINLKGKRYQYNGSGDTADLKNYTALP